MFKNTFFEEHLQPAASDDSRTYHKRTFHRQTLRRRKFRGPDTCLMSTSPTRHILDRHFSEQAHPRRTFSQPYTAPDALKKKYHCQKTSTLKFVSCTHIIC